MDLNIKKNRENLFNSLVSQGFFVGEDGHLEVSFEDFCEQVDDEENVITLYENLVDAEVLVDEAGNPTISQDDFLLQLSGHYARRDFYPITENQRGIFIDWEMNRESTQYNIPDARRIDGTTAEALREALIKVMNAHPGVKTHFAMKDGDVVQVREDEAPVHVSVVELDHQPTVDFFQQRVVPFNLLEGPLYRLEIYHSPEGLYLFSDFHHTIFDGGSSLVFSRQLEAVLAGEEIEPESFTAFDRSIVEQNFWQSEQVEEAEKYYDSLLSGKEVTVYPHSNDHVGKVERKVLNTYLPADEIGSYCRQHNLTENSYYLTLFMQALHRITREEEVLITTIHHGRTDMRMADTFGMFVKTQPVCSTFTEADFKTPVEKAVTTIQKQVFETQRRDIYSFTKMVERHNVRAEIMFVFQGGLKQTASEVKETETFQLDLNVAKMPLTLVVYPVKDNEMCLRLEYDASLYSDEDMQRLGGMLKAIYQNAISCHRLSELSMLSEEDRLEVMKVSTGKYLDVDDSMTFAKAFVQRAQLCPDAPAVVDVDSQFTYAEMDRNSNILAHVLMENGIQPNSFVCVMLDRRKEFPLSVLAIHKIGAAYTPLDFEYPNERLSYMIENSMSKVLITTHDVLAAKMAEGDLVIGDVRIIYMDDIDFADENCNSEPVNLTTPDNLAYMIYTSGSTGKPKGAMLHQRGLWNFINVVIDMENLTAEDRIEGHRSFSFDAHIEDLYPVLTLGGSFHIMPTEIRKDLPAMHDFIVQHKITGGGYSTAVASLLINTYEDLPVRFITGGGEKMEGVYSDHVEIINVYGPTECTDDTSYYRIKPGERVENIPIGKIVANNWGFVIDQTGQLLPLGVAGEHCFAGVQVGYGYWQLPERTAKVFVDCPYVAKDALGRKVRMYHTGDLARWNKNGDLEYIGRVDFQVKLRGFRIELGEIESKTYAIPGIKGAVAAVKKIQGADHLVLYYSLKEGVALNDDDIRQCLQASSLAEYMVPDVYVYMENMPMTPNGKFNRKALPLPTLKVEALVAPETELEKTFFDIAAEQLKHNQFGVTTNLISVGLTSLIAMRLSAAIMQKTELLVPTKDIMKSPTIRQLVEIASGESAVETEEHITYEKREFYPISENQRGIYVDWEMNRSALQYNIPDVTKFEGMDVLRLQEALVAVVNAHPSLKASLVMREGDIMQRRQDDKMVTVTVTTLDFEPTSEFFQNRVRPFDLFNDNLYRLELYQTPQCVYLFKDIHHIIFDGASNFIFMNELKKAYEGQEMKAEEFTLFDRSLYENEYMQSEAFKVSEKYFDDLLADVEVAVYPHSSHPESHTNKSNRVATILDASPIDQFCSEYGLTQNSFFLTVLMQTLHRVTREENIAVATIDNGRNTSDMLDIMGMFVKTIPVVSKMDNEKGTTMNFVAAVEKMQKQFIETISHELYPYTQIVERYGIRPEIMFGYQGGISEAADLADSKNNLRVELDTAKAPLCIFFTPNTQGQYRIDIEYSSGLYTSEDSMMLLEALKNFAQNAVTTPENIADIALVGKEDETKIMNLSKGDVLEYNTSTTFPKVVLEHAAQTPEALAVVDVSSSLTYRQLDEQSAAIAGYLLEQGVQRGEFVGIKLPRQKEFLASILAIQRIGAAYIPIDPEYPADRIQYMMEDSEAKVVITPELLPTMLAGDKKAGHVCLAQPDGLAYMIYTSGSTGNPKGVMQPHRSLSAFLAWRLAGLSLDNTCRLACHASFSFDASLDDLFSPLAAGGTCYIMPDQIRKDMDAMYSFLVDHQITGMTLSTQLGMAMINEYPDLPIQFLMMGGEKMLPFKKTPIKVINGYGPTEFTVCSSYHVVDQDKDIDIPIGRPVPNTYSFICDKYGNLMPWGMAGELCLVGNQIADGYWKRRDLSEEKFVECMFKGGRMYRTGDLARYNAAGELEFLGRIDNQVKLRGFRIEMGEIENQARLYEGIKAVAAEVKEIAGGKHLCLYFTAESQIDTAALEAFLSKNLAEYMVPEIYMQLDEMPLTPNGKVNRKQLPLPELKSQAEYVKPEGEVERKIAAAFAAILNLSVEVGALDSFFALGGDSIKSIRLVSALRAEGIVLQVSQVMKLKTVRALADAAEGAMMAQISQEPWSGELKNSPIVEFFMNLELPKKAHFNQSFLLQAHERIDMNALQQVMNAIVTQHDMLRAVLQGEEGAEHLYVNSAEILPTIEEIDLTSASDYLTSAQQECEKRQTSIQMDKSLFNVAVLHLPSYDLLLMVCHHIVVDAVSWRIILEDLGTAYGQALSGHEIQLQAKTNTYNDYVNAVFNYRNSYTLGREVNYWRSVEQKMQLLPTSNGKKHHRKVAKAALTLDKATTENLLYKVSTKFHTEINDLLMTALGRSYYKLTGNKAVSVQFEGHGREDIGGNLLTDRTVGWFTSVYPVVLEGISGDMRKDIRTTKEIMHRVPNKGVGYNILRFIEGESSLDFDKDQVALIGFNYLGEMDHGTDNEKPLFSRPTEVVLSPDFAEENKFGPALNINSSVVEGVLNLTLETDADVMSEAEAGKFASLFVDELREMTEWLMQKTENELTASDLGENEWSDEVFEGIYQGFKQRGVTIQRIYPLSPMQEGILLYYILNPDSLAYRLVTTYSFDILPTEEQLRYALDRLGAKHEVLRTSIIYKGVEAYRQAIVDRPLGIEMRDVSDEEDIEKAVREIHLAEQKRGFDLQKDSLFRITCVKTSDNTCKLILSVHHIIVDGWCIELFTSDLLRYLVEAMQGVESEPDTSNDGRYEAYIREIRSKDMEKGLAYWDHLLKDYSTTAVIPLMEAVPEEEQTGDRLTMKIKGDDMTRLMNLCTEEQITPNTLLELAWGLTLNAYNHSNDSVFVKVVSGRNASTQSVENVVGLFINSVPVRVTVEKGHNVRQSLQALQNQASETNEWDYCPLAEIQNRTMLGQDLFQSILAFENYSDDDQKPALPFSISQDYSKEESFNDLTITAYTGKDELTINMEFDKRKYLMRDMEEVANVLKNIIRSIVNNPEMETLDIPCLEQSTILKLMDLGRGATLAYDKSETLVDLFRKQVSKTPEAPCVVFEGNMLTYAQVDEMSDSLAVYLHQRFGVTNETAVGVMIDRSELMLLYPMAIMKAGAAYMPLDFHFPAERLSFMCNDANIQLILSEGDRVKNAIPDYEGEVVLSDIFAELQPVRPEEVAHLPKATPDNMFVILYTSGSTGMPKGVMLEHHNIVNFCHWYIREFDVTAADKAVAYANFGFDAHMMDIYPIISVGGSVYIIESQMRMDLMAMNKYMEDNGLSIAFMTTQVGYMFATTIENHSLRLLSVGGEKLQPLKKPSFRFYNGYGPTECTLYSTCYHITTDYDSSLIGRPLANYQLFVVDHNMNLVPRGASGELIVAGEGVGRGYLNRPDVNAEKFITFEVPYGEGKKSFKAYRTGDLVRWSNTGDIEFLGRLDNQVKLRGLRIELGEIEARVSAYSGIKTCAVDVKEIAGAQHICCYFEANTMIDTDNLRTFIAEKLTDYMVPTAYMQIEKLPLTQNGKVNRRALPIPSITIQTENIAPENHKEQILFNLVSELLHTDNFGVTDDLTKLGLTSLLGIKLVVMAGKQGIDIKLSDLMKARTIRNVLTYYKGIACWLNEYKKEKPVVVVVCGATPFLNMRPYCEALSKDYSVLIFEPLSEHYDHIFIDESIHEVVEFYYALLDWYIGEVGGRVSVFTGHCFGGELAYRLAVRYEQETGISAPMVMLDVFWKVEKNENSMEAMVNLIPEDVYRQHHEALDSYRKAMRMYDNLSREGEPELYHGDVVLFRALQEEPVSPEMKAIFDESDPTLSALWDMNTSDRKMDNGAFWTKYYPKMEVYGVEGHHMSMLGESYVSKYVDWMNSKITKR